MSPELIGILSVGAAMLIGLGGVVSVNVRALPWPSVRYDSHAQ